ncbi:MAG: hypothetical protein WAT39_07315 [Planctomycetota bacterium]
MAPKVKLTDVKVKQVALLTSLGRSQKEIKSLLGLSQASISRGMRRARQQGYLLDQPICTLPPDEIAGLEQEVYSPELLVALQRLQPAAGAHLRHVRIFHVGRGRTGGPGALERYRDRFGQLVAQHLLEQVFPHVRSMGVTWGGTLLSVVRGFAACRAQQPRPRSPIEFFPVCGSPPDAIEAALRSSSNLVALLDEQLNDATTNPNNFTGVCASFSSRLSKADIRAVKKYFRLLRGYGRVFGLGNEPGRIDTMDAVITSIGNTNAAENPWLGGAADAAGVDPALLAAQVVGNLGGLFLPRPGLDAAKTRLVERVNAGWTGIGFPQFFACSARASKRERGGTILVAYGRRSDVTLECVRRGLVSELLIDSELATGLLDALGLRRPVPL